MHKIGKNILGQHSDYNVLGGLRALTTARIDCLSPSRCRARDKLSLELTNCVTVSLPLHRPNIYITTRKKSSIVVRFHLCSYVLLSLTEL